MTTTNWNAATCGKLGGKRAVDLFIKRFVEGSHADAIAALPGSIERAKVEATAMLTSSDPKERQTAEYWLAFYAELEEAIATANAGRQS
jgi:hypothetical protein